MEGTSKNVMLFFWCHYEIQDGLEHMVILTWVSMGKWTKNFESNLYMNNLWVITYKMNMAVDGKSK